MQVPEVLDFLYLLCNHENMDAFTQEHKKEVERMLVETIIAALQQGTLSDTEVPTLSAFILERVEAITTHEEMVVFLRELSGKWPIFTPLLVLESGEAKEKMEESVVSSVLKLAKENKVEEAIDLAKSATKNQQDST